MTKKYKILPPRIRQKFINTAKMMFFAHRDCLWNRFEFDKERINPNDFSLVASDGYYGEFFGMFRTLEILGYGYFGADCPSKHDEFNLKEWAHTIERECLTEEDWKNSNKESCFALLEKYRNLV